MCHENEKDIFGDVLTRTLDIINSVKGVYSIYDPANFIQCGEKADDTIKALVKKAYYFHIKDVIEDTGELVPAGYGDGDLKGLVAQITGDKVLTIEPHLKVFDGYVVNDSTVLKTKFKFESNVEAFDAAVGAIKKILFEAGYEGKDGVFLK